MKTAIYNQKGEKTLQIQLPKEMFEIEANPDLIHQVLVSLQSNQRQGTAHAKDRSEVRGGGIKPWRQKGTGRARHGSRRSPIWVGGGVTFGPRKERNYKKEIPVKMKRKALFGVFSSKLKNNQVFVIEDIKIKEPKTKIIKNQLEEFLTKACSFDDKKEALKSVLIIFPGKREDIVRAVKNIPGAKAIEAKNLNVLDLAKYKNIVLLKDSIKVIKETFLHHAAKDDSPQVNCLNKG